MNKSREGKDPLKTIIEFKDRTERPNNDPIDEGIGPIKRFDPKQDISKIS